MTEIELLTQQYKNRPSLQSGMSRKRFPSRLDAYLGTPEGRGQWIPSDEPETIKVVTHGGFRAALWAELNHRLGVSPDQFNKILYEKAPSPYIIDKRNIGKIDRMITIILDTKAQIQKKGIWLEGKTGSGKTFLMDAIIDTNNRFHALGCSNVQKINRTSYYNISIDIEKSQKLHVIDQSIQGSCFIDDYYYRGEPMVQIYGKSHNLAELIVERWEYLRQYRPYTTSNFSIDDIRKNGVYPASVSRLYGLFETIVWEGDIDFRKSM